MMKDTLIFALVIVIALLLALSACEIGQKRVDAWEARTGRYGQGLR